MATFVLVHGGNMSTETWNKLTVGKLVFTKDGKMGGSYWDGTVFALTAHGHRAFAPTLGDENTTTLTGHIGEICSLITENAIRDIILVGHSYGGMVITGVAAQMPERIHRLVYLDAAVPDPGESLYNLLMKELTGASGNKPLIPEPSPPYVEKLSFNPEKIRQIPKTYILCTKSEFAAVTRIMKQKINRSPEKWTYLELPTSHVPMASMPDAFYRMMLDIAEK